MYNLKPPKDALDWKLGLILEISAQLGLGKPGVTQEAWREEELSERVNKSQLRNWWQRPPRKFRTLNAFIETVTQDEPYAAEWLSLFQYAHKANHSRGKTRERVFGVTSFNSDSLASVIIPKLRNMEFLELADVPLGTADAPPFKPWPKWFFAMRRTVRSTVLALLLMSSIIAGYQYLNAPKYQFGEVFTNIRFCLEDDFIEERVNKCTVDERTFYDDDSKIYFSFESYEELDELLDLRLEWFRNGERVHQKSREWTKAFALELKYASTHIVMQKFDFLPPEWAEPGRYHVRFFLEDVFVHEAGFYVEESVRPLAAN